MELSLIHMLLFMFNILNCHGMPMEPSCTSFEYDKKILETIVRMEFDFKKIAEEYKMTSEKVNDELVTLSKEKTKFIKEITGAQEKQLEEYKHLIATATAGLLEMKDSSKTEIGDKLKELNTVFENQQATMQRLSEDIFVMKNETLKELTEQSRHSAISFRASSSFTVTISAGSSLAFPVVSVNHGNGYDPSTGRFTAPEKGTYMFIVQFCFHQGKQMVINIMVDGTVHMWAYVYDADAAMCSSHSDVINLDKGTEVWIQCGSSTSSSFYLYHSTHQQNIFAGYIL